MSLNIASSANQNFINTSARNILFPLISSTATIEGPSSGPQRFYPGTVGFILPSGYKNITPGQKIKTRSQISELEMVGSTPRSTDIKDVFYTAGLAAYIAALNKNKAPILLIVRDGGKYYDFYTDKDSSGGMSMAFSAIANQVRINMDTLKNNASNSMTSMAAEIKRAGGNLQRISTPLAKAIQKAADQSKVPATLVMIAVLMAATFTQFGY